MFNLQINIDFLFIFIYNIIMKLFFVKKISMFLCVIAVMNLSLSTYAYEFDFFYKHREILMQDIQHDLTYFGEEFTINDYNDILKVYKLFENEVYYARYYPFDLNTIKKEIVSSNNFLDYVLITGDSYSWNLYNCFVKYYDYKNGVMQNAGHTVVENLEIYKNAMSSEYPIIVLSTSVNDVLRQTDLSLFKKTIEDLFDFARINNKLVVIHSNCDFFVNGVSANSPDLYVNRPKVYDEIIKLTSIKYENVVYVDCKHIATREYLSSDDIHYNEKFHYQLAKEIYDSIKNLLYKGSLS